MKINRKNSLIRIYLIALGGCLAYGGWVVDRNFILGCIFIFVALLLFMVGICFGIKKRNWINL